MKYHKFLSAGHEINIYKVEIDFILKRKNPVMPRGLERNLKSLVCSLKGNHHKL